jgi:hypothetical protein
MEGTTRKAVWHYTKKLPNGIFIAHCSKSLTTHLGLDGALRSSMS